MAEYLMGIDAGTGSVRVALFDFRGQNRAYAVAEYGTTYPKNGWAEQSDYEWFEALKKAIRKKAKNWDTMSYLEKRKVFAYLYRKGFKEEDIRKYLEF